MTNDLFCHLDIRTSCPIVGDAQEQHFAPEVHCPTLPYL